MVIFIDDGCPSFNMTFICFIKGTAHYILINILYYINIFRIVSFQKKTDAQCVALVFDTNGLEGTKRRPGYHHPSKYVETPRGGLESYPAIFSYPNVSWLKNISISLKMVLQYLLRKHRKNYSIADPDL